MSIHRLMPDILADTMITSARARKPFSMVRMGDGEFAVMKYPKYCERNICIDHISRWFDVSNITEKQVLFISKAIWESCITADLLGIPSGREQGYLKWARLEWFMEYFKLMKATHFHFYLIMQMHLEGVFHKMLADFDEAFCITCRNVEEGMKRSFGLKK